MNKNKIWLISDLHLNHNREFIWSSRGFNSVYEMNDTIIQNWNNIVSSQDDIYCLGDLMLGDSELGIKLIKQLKGNIHIVRGNHDSNTRMELYNQCYNIVEIGEGKFLNYHNYHFFLSHYPCLCSNYDDDKSIKKMMINLCGHRHVKDPFYDWDKGVIYHCEVDAHNYFPIEINDIIEQIKNKLTSA